MARKPLMAGNWKMNLDHLEAIHLVQGLAMALDDNRFDYGSVDVVVVPPFTDLRSVQTVVDGDGLKITYGAQDVSTHAAGAYTGEISATMISKLGAQYVVVGHSERREYHHETDAVVSEKAKVVIEAGMTPIICCGEGIDIRREGLHVNHVLTQITGAFLGMDAEQASKAIIAYEPIWAIGTGEVATPLDAQEVCAAIRAHIGELYSAELADGMRILYGGSVKSSNAAEIMAQPDVDGGLVGGASLKADEFSKIVMFQNS